MDLITNKNYEGDAPLNARNNLGDNQESPKQSVIAIEVDAVTSPISVAGGTDTASKSPSPRTKEVSNRLNKLNINTDKRKKGLSGAATKRLRYLLKQGVPKEEARVRCLLPIEDRQGQSKRLRSQDSSGSNPSTPLKKGRDGPSPKERPSATLLGNTQPIEEAVAGTSGTLKSATANARAPKPSYSAVTEARKVAIVDSNYPGVLLTAAQMTVIQTELMDLILEEADSEVYPQFGGCTHKPGWMAITCANQSSHTWLKTAVPRIKLEGVDQLKIVEEDELPRSEVMIVHLPNCTEEQSDKILRRIRAQNEGLRTGEWKVLHRKDDKHTQLTLSVDPISADRLRERKLKVNWLFGSVYFRESSRNKGKRPNPDKEEASKGTGEGKEPPKKQRKAGKERPKPSSKKHQLPPPQGQSTPNKPPPQNP